MAGKNFIKFSIFASIAFFAVSCGSGGGTQRHETSTYKNAVFGAGADPSIFRDPVSKKYYCFTTQDAYDWKGTGETITPFGPILESTDMVNWTYVGAVFNEGSKPDWLTNKYDQPVSGDIWAPHMIYHNNLYYYYYTLAKWGNTNNGIGVATAPSPKGPFTDHGKVVDQLMTGSNECIDPCVVKDGDKLWMSFGSMDKILLTELTADGLHPKNVDQDDNVECKVICGQGWEGSYLEKMNGYWYLFVSGGTCCEGASSSYFVASYRSSKIDGIYQDLNNYPATMSGTGETVISPYASGSMAAGTGHNSIAIDDDGIYWLIYHAYELDPNDKTKTIGGRKICVDELTFEGTGFPHVKNLCSTMGRSDTKAPYIALNQ